MILLNYAMPTYAMPTNAMPPAYLCYAYLYFTYLCLNTPLYVLTPPPLKWVPSYIKIVSESKVRFFLMQLK